MTCGGSAQRHKGTEAQRGGEEEGKVVCPECGHQHDWSELAVTGHRVVWSEASGLNPFKWLATTHGATLFAVVTALCAGVHSARRDALVARGRGQGGLILWPLFGATNQLLAGFAFVVIVAWLIATRRPWWFAIVPGVFMLCVPASAMAWQAFIGNAANPSWLTQHNWVLLAVGSVTLGLEAWLLVEVGVRWLGRKGSGDSGIDGIRARRRGREAWASVYRMGVGLGPLRTDRTRCCPRSRTI